MTAKQKISEKAIREIENQIKENNARSTAMYKVSNKAGRKAGLEADAKLKKLFKNLGVDPTEYALQKLGVRRLQ